LRPASRTPILPDVLAATVACSERLARSAGWRWIAGAIASTSLGVFGGGTAAAQPSAGSDDSLALSWSAPAECPDADAVRENIARILGGPPRPDPPLAADVEVWEDEAGAYAGRLLTRQAASRGERELTGKDCAEVAHAVALVLALMVAPPSPDPAPPPPAPTTPRPPLATEPQLEHPAQPRWTLRTGVQLGVGTLPDSDAGAAVHFGAVTRRISAELRAAAWLPRTAYSDAEPHMGAELWMLAATPTACLRWQVHRLVRLDSCAGVGITLLRAEGFGMSDPTTVNVPWGTARLEQAAAVSLARRVRLRPGVELSFALGRPVLAIENVGEIHRPDLLSVAGVLAAELAL